ncbi:MAG: hypothetical protein ACYC5Y_11250 [Symbiobacteriia bacterium]
MDDNYEKLFYEEVREKRTTASGVHGLKGKRGLVGKMVTPADLSPRSYKAAKDLGSFNVVDFLQKLAEAPGLRSVLLGKMDEEYRNYRLATEKTLDAVAELLFMALEPLRETLLTLDARLARLEGRDPSLPMAGPPANPASPAKRAGPARLADEPAQPRRASGKPRIRWGSTEEEIRQTVRARARALLQEGQALTVSNIQKQVPSMLRYLYGEKAVFPGLKGLIHDLESKEAAGQ